MRGGLSMKKVIYNLGYFVLEAVRTIRFNPLSNFFSVLGTGLILFLLSIVLTGWSIGDQIVITLEQEAEISAYLMNPEEATQLDLLTMQIEAIEGVTEVTFIPKEEAKLAMEELLGNESDILELFEENPFEAFLEIRIDLQRMDAVLAKLSQLDGIEYVRDNRGVLEQMKQLTDGVKIVGAFILLAVGITTLILISHMIRQGIYNNREQINTLRLLGAPGGFIGFPYVLAGTLMTIIGGIIAVILLLMVISGGYRQLSQTIPFIPLPKQEQLQSTISLFILSISAGLGILGSLFGLSSLRKDTN
jgi:cell division transport system permease protein